MKKFSVLLALLILASSVFAQVHTTYLWHMQQPIYWPEKSKANPDRYQTVKESFDLKSSGDSWNVYSDGISHPLNNLQEIFGKDDRVNAYQHGPKNSVSTILGHPDAGAQVNYSGCLIENVNSLANDGAWGYYSGWEGNFSEAKGWTTSGDHPRMDMIGFTFHHALSPLISERALSKELQAHRYISTATFGGPYSKGYWPAECSFSERIIKVLVEEGIEWSIVANSHLSRTLNDYPDNNYGTSGVNIDPPNAADKVATNGNNWWSGQIDGRGGTFAAPYSYQAHKAKYVDPETGTEYKIDVVPMADLLSYQDGYQTMSTSDIENYVAPYDDPSHPSIVLLAHDGDNAFAGGYSYYQESVQSFTNAAASKGYSPTTIQQFLTDHPVPESDLVKVEDGSWVNAESDWGHPQFINWLWPLYENTNYCFDPDGWTEDARNWAVITAAENYVITAEDLVGNVDISDIVSPSASASNAEKAWHFFLPSLTSGYMYYGKAIDMEVKQTIAGNNAIEYAQAELAANPGIDNTAPSVFIPQRFPYNPGGKGFGPIYGYQEFDNSSDFHIWTFAFDVSGLESVVLKYRTDNDGVNPLTDNVNDVYANGAGVSSWSSVDMTIKEFPKTNITGDPEIDFFVLPTEIADLCYAEISGLSNVLVDYYVEATDTKGNTFKTPIQHVYVGNYRSNDDVTLSIDPPSGNYPDGVDVTFNASTTANGANITIYYTLDGSDPDGSSTLYTSPINLSGGSDDVIILKAIAIDSEGNRSEIVTCRYTFGNATGFDIHFKNTSNWNDVYVYLFDNSNGSALPGWTWPGQPMTQESASSWFEYTVEEAVEVGIVFNNNNNGQQSGDLERTYDGWYDYSTDIWYDNCPGDCPDGPVVPILTINPASTGFTTSVSVELSATNDGVIYYTIDGSEPTGGSDLYAGTLTFTETTRLRSKAFNDAGESNEVDETFTKETVPVPELSADPQGGSFNSSVEVSLIATNGGNIYFTTDGTDPDNSGIPYSSPIIFTETANLKAVAYNATGASNIIDETYIITHTTAYDVHFKNTSNWNDVYIYLFDKNTGSQLSGWNWPGVPMTQEQGSQWYMYNIDESVEVGIVFNNNNQGQQSSDQFRALEGWYDFSSNIWYNQCPGDCPGEQPDGITIYYNNNSTNWNSPTLYYWATTPVSLSTSWPGVSMNGPDVDGWYSYTLDGVECANVIFSNSGGSQTEDLYTCGDSYYDNGWVSQKSTTSINLTNNQSHMRIFPNPVRSGEVTIMLPDDQDASHHVSIYNFTGKLIEVLNFDGTETRINTKGLMSGLYFISVTNQETNENFKQKLFVY